MKKILTSDFIKSSELPLAAVLVYSGFPLDHLEKVSDKKLNFVFLRHDGVDETIQGYWSDSIVVSPKRYFYILRELKSRIREVLI